MIRVILVEDDQNDVYLTKRNLNKQISNLEIQQYQSFGEFKNNWNASATDIVITDHNLGDGNSFEVIELVRKQNADLPIIILSGSLLNHEIVRFIMEYKVNEIVLKSELSKLHDSIVTQIESYRAKQLLRDQKEEVRKLSLVAKHTHNGVVILNQDIEIEWVNEAYTTITGFSLEESIGKRPAALLQGSETSVEVLKNIREHLEKRQSFSKELVSSRKNGEQYWIKLDFTPIFEQGKFTGYVAIQEEISDRVESYKKLKESEDRLDVAIHGADLGVWDLDMETEIILVNDFWYDMLGYQEGELIPNLDSFYQLLHPDDFPIIADAFAEVNSGVNVFDFDIRLRHKNGEYRIIRDRGRVIKRFGDGTVRRIIGTHLDITAEKTLEDELNSSLAEKTILLQEIHHRVKNNLAIIIGLLHLQAFSVDNEELSCFYDQMSRRIKSIADVHEMLYQSDSFSNINLKKYAEKIFDNAVNVQSKSVTPTSLVFIDEGFNININQGVPLGLLLNELITNSIKHAFKKQNEPAISFTVLHLENSIQCIYKDNGSGCKAHKCSESNSFGFTLIHTLLEQLGASHAINTNNGFELTFTFQVKHKGSHSMI
ncbi:MAG: PAS domain-containing protein [Balneolaceae bacterium]|nr:PAS domain-containing protein [Balneolaceae bacterium]